MTLLLLLLGLIGSVVVFLALTLGSLLFKVLGRMLSNELEVAVPELAQGLLEKAVQRVPEQHRERLGEEWRAGLRDSLEKRPLWALMQAASLYQRAPRIAAELEPAPIPAEGSSNEGSSPATPGDLNRVSGITARFLGRLPLHALGARVRLLVAEVTFHCMRALGLSADSPSFTRLKVRMEVIFFSIIGGMVAAPVLLILRLFGVI